MVKTDSAKNETEATVVLPLYEWNLLRVLLQYVSEHTAFCGIWAGVQIPEPEWIPAGRHEREEAGIAQSVSTWEYILTALSRIDEHFAKHICSDFEFAQALPDFAMRKELMLRFYVYNNSLEDAAQDAEIGTDYRWIDTNTLAWYLARQILVYVPELRHIVLPMQAHELKRKARADVSAALSYEQAQLIQDAFTLAKALTPDLSDADCLALTSIADDLQAPYPESVRREELVAPDLLKGEEGDSDDYEVSFLFEWNSGAEGIWTDIYCGSRLDVVNALLAPGLHPILLARGVKHIIVPPQVNRPMRELPIVQYAVERSGDTTYTIWAALPGEDAYLVGHAELNRWTERREPQTWEVWSYVGHGFALWGTVAWNGKEWQTALLHSNNSWGIASPFPQSQLVQAIAHVFANEYQSNVRRFHPTLKEKK